MTPAVVSGPSGKTTIAGRAIGGAVLGTISNLAASAGDTTLALTWTAAANATSHQPQYRTGADAFADFGAPLSGAATSVTITGLTNGTAYDVRVIAGDGSTTTTSNVDEATPTEGDAWELNNLPGGLDLAHDTEWEGASIPAGWSIADKAGTHTPVMVTGQSPPSGDTYVVEQSYEGVPDGQEPNFLFRNITLTDELFAGFIVKFGPAWDQPSSSGHKFLIIGGSSGFAGWVGLGNSSLLGDGNDLPRIAFTTDASTATPSGRTDLAVIDNAAILTLNTWHKVELLLRRGGAGDLCKLWVNGVAVVDTDVTYSGSFAWAEGYQFGGQYQQCATLGGGTGTTGNADHLVYFDRTAFWRRSS